MLKQTLFFSKPCKLSLRLKWLVEEEKKYTTIGTMSELLTELWLVEEEKRYTNFGVPFSAISQLWLVEEEKRYTTIAAQNELLQELWLVEEEKRYTTSMPLPRISGSCGLLKKRRNIQQSVIIITANVVVAC